MTLKLKCSSISLSSNRESIIKRVCEGKLKEIRLGLDGFMVHDLELVPHINQVNCTIHKRFRGNESDTFISVLFSFL